MIIESESPSNIALVKYWGKHGLQLPLNPSVSFTLEKAKSITKVEWVDSETFGFNFSFEGGAKPSFEPKLQKFFERISELAPELEHAHLKIDSSNTFPHSSGIASSASAFSALAIAIAEGLRVKRGEQDIDITLASKMARLGSGSACRSVFPKLGFWGEHKDVKGSSNHFAIDVSAYMHPVFQTYRDTILLVDEGVKSVSSTAGHALMEKHVFRKNRIDQAFDNAQQMMNILSKGELNDFVDLVEREALTLHALMMSAQQPYLLMRPGTVAIIEEVRAFRRDTETPVCFTLDAGANVHLLYPENVEQKVNTWVNEVLSAYCNKRYLCDQVGNGPRWKSSV